MTFGRLCGLLLPPVAAGLLRSVRRRIFPPANRLIYAPLGWHTELPAGAGFGSKDVIAQERRARTARVERFRRKEPLLTEPVPGPDGALKTALKHNIYMTFGYVLALAGRNKDSLKVLDYGANLGDSCWLAKELLPGVAWEYHCREVPAVAEEGRRLVPEAVWHTDDSCLEQAFDLVMFSSSLQYIEDWAMVLRRAAVAARGYLFLTMLPVVERAPTYAAVQSFHGAAMIHLQFNKDELLSGVRATGLKLAREFFLGGAVVPVEGGPEQPTYRGWLFQRAE